VQQIEIKMLHFVHALLVILMMMKLKTQYANYVIGNVLHVNPEVIYV
jgi:hypothetical protein